LQENLAKYREADAFQDSAVPNVQLSALVDKQAGVLFSMFNLEFSW
jgi:hypothetical protein